MQHHDNITGICHAIGTELNFNPIWLRLALSVSLLFAPMAVLSVYASLGAIVLIARLLVPLPRRTHAQLA